MKYFILTALLFGLFFGQAQAQKGFLRGTVFDGETGEPLIGAVVFRQGTTDGTVTDFNGNYSLPLQAGTHTIVYQFVSFRTTTVENLEIVAEKVNTLDVTLQSDVEELAEVVVTAQVIKNSESALLSVQKKSANVLDGISAQTFRKIGDSNLSGAMKRVTGVSVQGGKYVYVRGLGDRYTRTTLNGMSIPGLDPERNDVQIDLFPTNVLENVMVYKTFSPELAGDFAGGTVNVETKSFPEEKTTRLAIGLGYNPKMNLINNFTSYEGSNTDFLGYDDGARKIPLDPQTEIPRPTSPEPANAGELLESYTRSFNPTMAAKNQSNFLNSSLSFNHGNQLDLPGVKFGYGVVLNYQNQYDYYGNTVVSSYFKDNNKDVNALDAQFVKNGELGRQNVLWSGLITSAVKFNKHELGLTFLKTQNGIKTATNRVSQDFEETSQTAYENILTYTQRSLTSPTIYGKHNLNKWTLQWSNSVTLARVYDPDFRQVLIAEVPQYQGGEQVGVQYFISGGQGGSAGRFWRDLNETNENFRLDATYALNEKVKLKVGGAGLYKWRTFDTFAYNFSTNQPVENDADWILRPENIWTPDSRQGIYVSGNYEAANNYEARSSVNAAYVMSDAFITPKLRAIFGVRAEQAQMYYTGQDNLGSTVYDDEQTLDQLNLLPSLNMVYSLKENVNLRGSYGRTLARPSFREKSIAQILDPVSGVTFSGNIDLEQTNIDNFDLRWENFFGREEMVSVSAFYKKFNGHIEQTRFELEPREVTWQNIGGSYVYGLELEFRKKLPVEGLMLGSNLSWAQSHVDMTQIIVSRDEINNTMTTEYESRKQQARTDETIDKDRVMAGQAPYLINAFLNYSDFNGINSLSLSYNVQGESLSVVGVGQVPDVYVKPFHSFNLNVTREIGERKNGQIRFTIDNILGDSKEQVWKNHESGDELFSRFDEGRTFTLRYQYSF
ncbi:TonB-dependent receptor [Marinoscillum luteum]|uniref:TonB-dependent receptor domain-containing protein n=1 Tax=Marinoscillum luteum TaxID=861051 RepID=A0ABW7N6Y1_9BACT